MLRQERDHILRLIAAAAAIARRLREMLTSGAPAAEVADAARAAQRELLGAHAALLGALDPTSAATLLADPPRVAMWVELMRVEAAALRHAGHDGAAAAIERRADALALASGASSAG